MTDETDNTVDALCKAAADVGRHIAGLAEELSALRHPHAPAAPSPELVTRQINKLRDQAALLAAVIEDIGRQETVAA
jgi:hypothetical protein